MKLVLQNRKTLLFVEGPRRWTPEPSQARIFGKTAQAVTFCHDYRLTDMQVIMKYPPAGLDLTVALPASFDPGTKPADEGFSHFPYT